MSLTIDNHICLCHLLIDIMNNKNSPKVSRPKAFRSGPFEDVPWH
jgi:hypothetical protein